MLETTTLSGMAASEEKMKKNKEESEGYIV